VIWHLWAPDQGSAVGGLLSVSDESKKIPDDSRLLPKHVGACILNKGVIKFSACVGCFCYV
jgi:hypothetical protein